MGLSASVPIPSAEPTWHQVRDRLAAAGTPPVLRMIDGSPAFPDEVPADGWRELRVSLDGSMVTVRRGAGEWTCVVWGTGDPALLATRDRVAAAIADATG